MTEKRQTSQGYIVRTLQHFATKLRNITNFVMLFQAVVIFLSRLIEIKSLFNTKVIGPLDVCSSPFLFLSARLTRSLQGV